MKYKYIFWDWNGTIMDDVQVALDAVNVMLNQWNRFPISLEEYRRAMDTPILRFYEQFFDMEETSFDWIAKVFNEYYREHQNEIPLHQGVEEKLELFQKNNVTQVVLSSSSQEIIERYAGMYEIKSYFQDILGASDLLAASKIDRAIKYFKEKQIPLEEAVLIGDAVHDYEVAKELGIDCIPLSCGHQDKESLEKCGCPVYETLLQWEM